MVNGVIYATAGTRRAVIALDAKTGELLWTHGEHEGVRGGRRSPGSFGPRFGLLERRETNSDLLCHARISSPFAGCQDRLAVTGFRR